jgi:isopentenyldiphosphate isomerase
MEEYIEVVDYQGKVIGKERRSVVHGNPSLLHRVVHVLIINSSGEILLQKRSQSKDVAPGRWDTSVGGHVGIGEDLITSCMREMEEELGITHMEPEYLYSYIHGNEYETELVATYRCFHEGGFVFNKEEIDEVRFWNHEAITSAIGRGELSDNFEQEFRSYLACLNNRSLYL